MKYVFVVNSVEVHLTMKQYKMHLYTTKVAHSFPCSKRE